MNLSFRPRDRFYPGYGSTLAAGAFRALQQETIHWSDPLKCIARSLNGRQLCPPNEG